MSVTYVLTSLYVTLWSLKEFNSLIYFQIAIPAMTVLPCSHYILRDSAYNDQIKISHQCSRNMEISYQDNQTIMACDNTVNRTWMVSDDCQHNATFIQLLKVLSPKPVSPKDGEVNVGLQEHLMGPLYPNSFFSHLYLWKNGESRAKVTERYDVWFGYSPYGAKQQYPPNSKMLWQIEFHLHDGYLINNQSIILSPIWSFETVQVTDFSIKRVNSPEIFFTGRTMQVSWTVENIGSKGNDQPRWSDVVFLSRAFGMASESLLAEFVRIHKFILPGDTYTATATISIPNNLYGTVYVHVITDFYNGLSDFNKTNNHGVNLQPLIIKLTAPPDLQVTQVVVPERTFSGKCIIGCMFLLLL